MSSPADPAPADVVVAQYPGRQDRASESAPETVLGYAKGMLPEVEAMVRGEGGAAPRPVTLMGHSMGGLIVYEIARLLEARRLPVRLLVVSGTNSPQFTAEVPDHPTEDEALLEHMARINGTDPRILGNQQILRMALPVMKADYAAFDRYRDEDTTLLSAPILALGGASDGGVSPVSLRGWAERTSSTSRVSVFQGDHFFITHATDAVARTIAGEVAACV